MPTALTTTLAWWSTFYGDHQVASVGIRFLHLAGLMVGGGTAVAADWQVWRTPAAAADDDGRVSTLARLAATHRTVVPSLVLIVATGIAMAAADTETFLQSRLFFIKLGLVGVLLLNGLGLLAFERRASRPDGGGAWRGLRAVSASSLGLWFVLLLVGTWLTVGA